MVKTAVKNRNKHSVMVTRLTYALCAWHSDASHWAVIATFFDV